MASPSGLIHRLQASRPWRAWQRYGQARGGVLAGGMAYVAFLSLLPTNPSMRSTVTCQYSFGMALRVRSLPI